MTPQSEWLLQIYNGSQFPTVGTHGVNPGPYCLFGPDPGKWPAWWHDAVTAISEARSQANAIEMKS